MAVGSGSIKRVQKAAAQMQGDVPEAIETAKTEVKEEAPDKAPAKKAAPKKTASKSVDGADKPKTTTKKAAAGKTSAAAVKKAKEDKKDDIHEKKFQVISKIKSDLPYYLL